MTSPLLATYSSRGSTHYGAIVDGGVVNLSARFGKDYPTLREVIAAGALSSLAMAPFNAWPVLFLTFPAAVWLIDGEAARTVRLC